MASATGINNTTSSVQVTQPVVASAPSASTTSANAAAAKIAAQSQAASLSPRILVDPTAGVITQYLDSSGKVSSQFPSSAVVAYLRAGLTADGSSKHPVGTTSASA